MRSKELLLKNQKLNRLILMTPIIIASLLLTACGGSNSTAATQAGSASGLTEKVVDATAGGVGELPSSPANKHTYLNLDTGLTVDLTDAAAKTSTDWHIGFKRSAVILNGGASGAGSVTGAVADKQDDFYNTGTTTANPSVFLNATTAGELAAISAVKDTTGLTFSSDKNVNQITSDGGEDSWWLYNSTARTVGANSPAWNVIRGANGDSFAKLHVTNIIQASRDITVELFIQGAGNTSFSLTPDIWTAAIGTGGAKCYDIDTTTEVDCTTQSATWDVQVEVSTDGRSWTMWTNGGVRGAAQSGASFGTLTKAQADSFVASTTPGLTFTADSSSGVFKESSWYAYNLQNGHKLWPNYRVYAIDTGTNKFKLQITSYYGASGTSGMINIRFTKL